jgi:hypothetical protein
MDFQTAVRTRLQAIGAVLPSYTPQGGAATKPIFWGERPQNSPLPAIVLTIINDPIPAHLKDYQEVRSTLLQMDVYAPKYNDAAAIKHAAIEILKVPAVISGKVFACSFVERQRDSIETSGTININRQSVDFSIWHVGV